MGTPIDPSPAARAHLRAVIATRPSPTREQRSSQVTRGLVLALAPVVLVAVARGVPLGGRPAGYVSIVAVGWSALAVASSLWVLRPGRSALGRSRPSLLLLACVLPVGLLAASVIASACFPETAPAPSYGVRVHLVCAAMATALSLLPFIIVLWLFRRGDPVKPWATGAALGALTGTWAGTVIAIQCPHPEPIHVALGHALPIAMMAAVGAAMGVRVLAIRWTR